jgi:hypothetical protein
MKFIKKHKRAVVSTLGIVTLLLILVIFAWYPYQSRSAKSYLYEYCLGNQEYGDSCSQVSTSVGHLLIDTRYSYQTPAPLPEDSSECPSAINYYYSGDIFTIFGKHFLFDTHNSSTDEGVVC